MVEWMRERMDGIENEQSPIVGSYSSTKLENVEYFENKV